MNIVKPPQNSKSFWRENHYFAELAWSSIALNGSTNHTSISIFIYLFAELAWSSSCSLSTTKVIHNVRIVFGLTQYKLNIFIYFANISYDYKHIFTWAAISHWLFE